jgi:hypothetical protein
VSKTSYKFGNVRIASLYLIIVILETARKNSGALVRQRTIPTERPPLVGEVSANFSGQRVSRDQRNETPRPLISVFWTGAAIFLSSSPSIILTRLSGPRPRPTTSQKIW